MSDRENAAGAVLAGAGIEAREARRLLAHLSGTSEAILAAFPERLVDAAQAARFRELAGQRRDGVPLAYMLGMREFYGREFRVSPAVLIPRPETELLVDCALQHMRADESILDLGTGSGAIAITLACERSGARITAVDRSAAALVIARDNAATLAPGRIAFIESDWYTGVGERSFNLIVSNPPYIAAGDPHLGRGDLRFEPPAALVAGTSGTECLESIATGAKSHLCDGGWLLLEHGFDQGAAARRILERAGFAELRTWRDLAGHERVTGGALNGLLAGP